MAGLFGFLFLGLRVVAEGVENYKDSLYNIEAKKRAVKKNDNIWVDHYGCARYVHNNQKIMITVNNNGDRVINDVMTGRTIKNISKQRREKLINEKIKNSQNNQRTVYCCDPRCSFVYNKKLIKGRQYKDLKNGRVYVIRYIDGAYYYVDIQNEKFVRATDSQLEREKKYTGISHTDVNEINKRATELHKIFTNTNCWNGFYNSLCDVEE